VLIRIETPRAHELTDAMTRRRPSRSGGFAPRGYLGLSRHMLAAIPADVRAPANNAEGRNEPLIRDCPEEAGDVRINDRRSDACPRKTKRSTS
jgi:hypothetical protein